MFIKLTRSGPRTYLQIVEAYRDPDTGRPKQRHLATLGRLEHLQEQDVQGFTQGVAARARTREPGRSERRSGGGGSEF